MKTTEIRQLSDKELKEHIEDEKNLYVRMKLNHAVSPLDNPLKLRQLKRNVARLNTELRQREIKAKQNS